MTVARLLVEGAAGLAFLDRYREIQRRFRPSTPAPILLPRKPEPRREPLARLVYSPPPDRPRGTKAFALAREILQRRGVSVREIRDHARDEYLVAARAEIIHALHAEGWSATRIGRVMRRDHSSVLSLLRARNPDGTRRQQP